MKSAADYSPQKLLNKEGWGDLTSGHPWVRAQNLKTKIPYLQAGLLNWGEHWFFYSPQSQLVLRRLGPNLRNWKKSDSAPAFIVKVSEFEKHFSDWLVEHFKQLFKWKESLFPQETCYRLVFSENDLIPGLIVDRFGDSLACQILSAPVELFWPALKKTLSEAFESLFKKPPQIIEMRNSTTRKKEGLEVIDIQSSGERELLHWNGLKWWMLPAGKQKTGSYLDQRTNHTKVRDWALKMGALSAWDLCSFEGGFGLHLAQAGLNVHCVDQSQEALDVLKKNAQSNGLETKIVCTQADIFEWIKSQTDSVDFVVLDPPSFVKDYKSKGGALRGFKELNLRALKLIRPGGMLVSCACSHHISVEDYRQMLQSAAHDVRRDCQIVDFQGPAADHSPLLGFEQGRYLQAWYLRVL